MLLEDVKQVKRLVKERDWEGLKVFELPGAQSSKRFLINLGKEFFTKSGQFANEAKGGLIEERTYIDYNSTIDEVIEIVRANRREFLK